MKQKRNNPKTLHNQETNQLQFIINRRIKAPLALSFEKKKKQPKFLKFILQKRKENENSLFGYSRKIKDKAQLIGYKYSNSEIWRL